MKPLHKPVLLAETLALLNPQPGESYFDGTAGYGGHAAAVIERTGNGQAVLVDRDADAIEALKERFGDSAEVVQGDFLSVAQRLRDEGRKFDLILLDLGVSSPQLDNPLRGFSFTSTAKLDMRMDTSQALSAYKVVNEYTQEKLADVIYQYGEETRSRTIARAIIAGRPIETPAELAQVIASAAGGRGKTHPATKTFQAIRIEVNTELALLEEALPAMASMLTLGGRLAVISFHSLEDRIVKQFIDKESKDCICPPKQPVCTCDHRASLAKLTTKAVSGKDTDVNNPRARSAKLRAAVKPKQK